MTYDVRKYDTNMHGYARLSRSRNDKLLITLMYLAASGSPVGPQ